MSNIELYNGDCLEIMKSIPDKSIDMVLCDLPYGTTACSWDIIIPFEPLWEQYKRVIKNNSAICLFGNMPFTAQLVQSNLSGFSHHLIWKKQQGSNFLLSNKMPLKVHEDIIVFYNNDDIGKHESLRNYFYNEKLKSNLSNKQINELLGYSTKGSGMAGHYFKQDKKQFFIPKESDYKKLQTTGYFKKDYAEILHEWELEAQEQRVFNPQYTQGSSYSTKSGNQRKDTYVGTQTIGGYVTINDGKRNPISIMEFSRDSQKFHPTQKPVALLEYLIKTYTNENAIVLDNCMGSGSTGVACKNINRNFIGIEKDENYFKIAEERINNHKGDIRRKLI